VTRVLRWGGVEPFAAEYDADAVAPAQFKQTPALTRVWAYRAGDRDRQPVSDGRGERGDQ
jgi:hypothetical protein